MDIKITNSVMEEWLEHAYFVACRYESIPSFSKMIEDVFEILHEIKMYENLDFAVQQGDHELYGMGPQEFYAWFSKSENNLYEPIVSVEDIIMQAKAYIARHELFIDMYGAFYLNKPLQGVW